MARNILEIRLDLIQKNFEQIEEHVKPLSLMAVLKANAYGIGSIEVAQALKEVSCSRFGVADVDEALQLKHLNVPLQILGDIIDSEIATLVSEEFIIPITSYENALKVSKEAKRQNKFASIHFLIDTGMGRLGMPIESSFETIQQVSSLNNLSFDGIYSHFPHAYGDRPFSEQQVQKFTELVNKLKSKSISFQEVHLANSDGLHNIEASVDQPFSMVRSGINLYGYYDLEGEHQFNLNEVLTLKSKLVAIRELPQGATVGYGRTYNLSKEMRVGTVAIGYADGIPIEFSNKGQLVVNGVCCPIIGRVSMDYTTIDLSNVEAEVGDDVLCLSELYGVNDWAKDSGTISYDIICSLGSRVKRVYLDGK
ncbi:MAG: alanine racemase [Lentisphaeraceae bacterium]|nr:alanine racemase [Lentisphaeraceae bacterium]